MSWKDRRGQHIDIQDLGSGVVLARFVGNDLGLFVREAAPELVDLIEHADRDPEVRVVVLTGSHPHRFISHADLDWLQKDGSGIPPLSRRITSLVARVAHHARRTRFTRWVARKTPLNGAIQLDQIHETFVRMTTSSTVFVAAINGSALGLGAEISWASDLRLMAEGDYVIGHLEVLLGFGPGAGGTQRLPRLIGSHRALVAMLEGRPFSAEDALAIGAIDEIVPSDQLIARAIERGKYLAARPPKAIAAIKRAVNVGGSLSMAEGLHLERAEFLALLPERQAQSIMSHYVRDTASVGELLVYQPGGYAAALQNGDAAVVTTKTD
ncbi:enoyl-CoA hydratase/isomerase family protein [Nocardioides pocheonensis]|uniref:Enoyl-CoA hydratase/isomerase family protein n=1 Tax=Nocardioides pocheonensis TaxID=661485 RepID=A0A3N0GH16_9ACTN|nr:enoyl-CoA hydratase/isomerase family protein [Nocardioides pocheonensis]RNM11763.1 enoyl-CoA hydratase/isomerase family protein [Nocardioides pocheonensis]